MRNKHKSAHGVNKYKDRNLPLVFESVDHRLEEKYKEIRQSLKISEQKAEGELGERSSRLNERGN